MNLSTLKKRKPWACTWQGKRRSGINVLLTHDWFETNIEYRQREWYCTTVDLNKYNTTNMHGPWHESPVRDSISVNATSTAVPNAVVTTRKVLIKQINGLTTPLKTKKVHEYHITKK